MSKASGRAVNAPDVMLPVWHAGCGQVTQWVRIVKSCFCCCDFVQGHEEGGVCGGVYKKLYCSKKGGEN